LSSSIESPLVVDYFAVTEQDVLCYAFIRMLHKVLRLFNMLKKYALMAVFLTMTAITLFTSISHHSHISETYGPIANIFVPTIAIVSFILGSFISLLFQWGINVIQFERVAKLLPESDASVILALFKRGRMTQTDIVSETGLSRATASRTLSSLEKEGNISRKEIENSIFFTPKVKSLHPGANVLTRFSGLSEQRVLIVVILLFLFGISLSLFNSYHVTVLEHPLEISLYLLAMEFFTLGASSILLLRRRISDLQLDRTLSILPKDEREILRIIHSKHAITQNNLVDESAIYKMKVSRIIAKFEQRGIIEKKPYGYTNKIISKL
jgi:uncharacterized membrane protein